MLDALDPASGILGLRVCDPAMGSGHFLVSLVDYLADQVLEAMSHAAESVIEQPWARDISNVWVSPLVARIADIRGRILKSANAHGWTVTLEQLDDRHIVRRMILKRVIYGVDKNPMAVELAKVALWLHTFTVGAPLSFLDHHLRCGDCAVRRPRRPVDARNWASSSGGLLATGRPAPGRFGPYPPWRAIGELTDIDIAEAHHSKALMDADRTTACGPLQRALDFLQARRWAGKAEAADYQQTWVDLLTRNTAMTCSNRSTSVQARNQACTASASSWRTAMVQAALQLAADDSLFALGACVPHRLAGEVRARSGGFDAVIGNPPWDASSCRRSNGSPSADPTSPKPPAPPTASA